MAANKHEIVIQDTCILFDLVDLSLLESFFQLDFVVYTTPYVIDEILTENHKEEITIYQQNGQLQVDSSGTLKAISKIFNEFGGLSFPDSSVLELAIRKDAVLFSADGSLRKISRRKKIIVRGTLWIIEKLYEEKLITLNAAIEKLENYADINTRAPIKEINKLISRLKNLED